MFVCQLRDMLSFPLRESEHHVCDVVVLNKLLNERSGNAFVVGMCLKVLKKN